MALLPNINVGTAPNDGTGDTIRNAFIKVNENFQFIETFFPNTDVANLTANITSTGTSTFNTLNAATLGNAGSILTGATVNAATLGNAGSILTGATVNAATLGNAGSILTGATVNAASIGNTDATITGSTVNAATIGNIGTLLTGTLTTNNQPNITSLGQSANSNISVLGNIVLSNSSIVDVRTIKAITFINPGGSYNVGFSPSNIQTVAFFMNSNVNLSLVGTIDAGVQKDFYFINNTASLKSTNIFVYGNRTNKGTNVNIGVSSNTTTLIKMISFDDTPSNIVAIISNV